MSSTGEKPLVEEFRPDEVKANAEPGPFPAFVSAKTAWTQGHWRRIAVVASVAILVGAAGGWSMHHFSTTHPEGQETLRSRRATLGFTKSEETGGEKSGSASRPETIGVALVSRPSQIRLTGTIIADEQSCVASNVNGIAAEVRVNRGSIVKKGDILVKLDPTDAENRLAEGIALIKELKSKLHWDDDATPVNTEEQPCVMLAKAALDLAIVRQERAKRLKSTQTISTEEYDQWLSEHVAAVQRHRLALMQVLQDYHAYQTAKAKLAVLRKAVADNTIMAPFDGMVVEKHVAVGEQVLGGFIPSKVLTMVRINPVRVSVTVPQQSIGHIELRQKLLFYVDSYPGKTFDAEVRYISPSVTSDTRSLLVECVADNAQGLLKPGLFVTASLELSQKQTEMQVPTAAVERTGEVGRVVVVRDGVARRQVVALGEEDKGKITIRAGLKGDELLLSRPELFQDGDRVQQ